MQGDVVPAVPFWLEEPQSNGPLTWRTLLLWVGIAIAGAVGGVLLWHALHTDESTPVAVEAAATTEPASEVPVSAQTVAEVAPTEAAPAAVDIAVEAPTQPIAPVVQIDA